MQAKPKKKDANRLTRAEYREQMRQLQEKYNTHKQRG